MLARSSARNLRTAAEAGVDQAALVEARERRRVIIAMLALPTRLRKAKPKPGKVGNNCRLELRFAARAV
jgi:hypothetical protein